MSSTTTVVKTKHRSTSSASQKFWPLKKFGLHHGRTEEQQSIPLSSTTIKEPSPVEPAKDTHVEKDAQKKTKNKRLSSLLSSRRQEANSNNSFQNLKSHVNTPESIAADNTIKQISNASNTPTLTRKTGREISNRTRTSSPNTATNTTVPKNNNNSMTAKSAGSGTLARSNNTLISSTTPSASPLNNNKTRTKELRNNSVRRSSEDKLLKRPQSPPSKRNNSPTQPNIMLESVQQQIQQEQLNKDDIDNDSAIEEVNDEDENKSKKDTAVEESVDQQKPVIELDSNEINEAKTESTLAELKPDTKEEEENNQVSFEENEKDIAINEKKQSQSPLPSPPITPAATEKILPDFTIGDSSEAENNTAASILNIHSEPVSPTLCTFDIQLVQKANEIDKQHILSNTFTQQQSIQRIHRLRPAASFATLRQLANTNNTYQLQQQLQQQQLPPQQVQKTKRRPVSYIEPTNNTYFNYANDDYLTVHRPTYYRRASSEDNRHFHTRQLSGSNTPPIQHHIGSRKLARSNTVHNIIIKDGHGHRIVQCIGLDEPAKISRRKTSSFENNDLIQNLDWSPPPEALDDKLFITRQQQLEEQQYHQQQLLQIQQQQNHTSAVNDNSLDTSSSDSSSHRAVSNRRIKRRDSAKSISSLCSSSPPNIHYDSRFTKLKNKLEKERATVKALQKQKEACNKDVIFLSKNVDSLTTENAEWKKKYENEKTSKERFQDDLSSTMDKLSEATEQIRQLENQTKILKLEIDDKDKEIRELEKKKQSSSSSKAKSYSEGKSTDRLLASQLAHSQNQVRLLKSTMEQFLRMGVFNDDLNSSSTALTSPTMSIDTIVPDFNKCVGKSRQKRSEVNKSPTSSTTEDASTSTTPPKSKKSKVPTDDVNNVPNKATKTPEKKPSQYQDEATVELDIQLRELLREKEILQAEYSKAPSSGGNALVRRRREELESRLDTVDSQMCRIKLKMRSRNIL